MDFAGVCGRSLLQRKPNFIYLFIYLLFLQLVSMFDAAGQRGALLQAAAVGSPVYHCSQNRSQLQEPTVLSGLLIRIISDVAISSPFLEPTIALL